MAALLREKTHLDRYLDETRVILSGVGPDVMLTLDAWYFRWLYDRAHALWLDRLGCAVVLLAAMHYLPSPAALDYHSLTVPARVVRALLDGP